jgi:hypothetical protein
VFFKAELWRHTSSDGWHFVTLPQSTSDEIRARAAGFHRPFGTLPVQARVGITAWRTSVFADSKRNAYVLPVKADVRREANVKVGDLIDVQLELLA